MLSDLRLTFRMLAKSPGFCAVAILTLALGLGVNTAMFSIINAILFRSLPYPNTAEIQTIRLADPAKGQDRLPFSWLDYADLRDRQTVYASLTAYREGTANVSGGEVAPERFVGIWVAGASPGELLGVGVQRGRWWRADEDRAGAPPVAVVSERIWRTRLGGRDDVIGQVIKVNGEAVEVIGVAADRFDFPGRVDLWQPQRLARTEESRSNRYLTVLGRRRPEVSEQTAAAEVARIVAQVVQEHPEPNAGLVPELSALRDAFLGNRTRPLLSLCGGAVSLVLLIACVNVANLLLARGATRAKEVALRAALGAGRLQVVRLLLLESLVLATAGALAGLPLGWALLRWFDQAMQTSGDSPPAWMTWTMDATVFAFVLGAVVLTCVLSGLVPALRLARPKLTDVLNDGSRGSTAGRTGRFTRGLVVAEMALSCVLLVGSGLMIRTVVAAGEVELGYEPRGLMTARIGLPEATYATPEARAAFFRELESRLSQRPDLAGAGLSSRLPTSASRQSIYLETESAATRPLAGFSHVSPGWFQAMGLPVQQGRGFSERDTADSEPVAIINARMAERFWPGADPIGRRFKQGDEKTSANRPWITVVGVIPSYYQGNFESDGIAEVYRPLAQTPERFMSLFVRGVTMDEAALARIIREEVQTQDPDLPVYFLRPLTAEIAEARFFQKLIATMFGIFGGIALVMAAVGLYGVMAYSVAQRTPEIGVRMALGATPRSVLGLVLRQGGGQLALGLLIGLPLAYLASRAMTFMLYGVAPGDPVTLTSVALVLGGAGLLACVVPASRALRVSPIVALRSPG